MPLSCFSVVFENFRRKTHCWKSHAEPDVKQLSGFDYQRYMTSKFTRNEPSGSLRLGKYLKSITVQNRRYRRTQGNDAIDILTQGTIDRAVKGFFKRLNACVIAKDGQLDSFTIHINCSEELLCYLSLNGVNCCVNAWMFLSTLKSIGGFLVMLIA